MIRVWLIFALDVVQMLGVSGKVPLLAFLSNSCR